ncbi:unnamed protein product [Rotaria sp. Silwood2]|nr:unnamed protein product [Rotaria sp. Silwood2]CAF2488835.1 unnamed protein product [Rotaria sp. Silwood2]CAF2719538.1 unnamed protein product [Rotaria sp. Silwood2]CAF3544033.1 unnamed protein product [Rotaria sp. Silwood2]CAF3919384.1 unnamed protein product [Rotaria sp. Silwood2]
MENIRLILISLHVFITISLIYNLHVHSSLVKNSLTHDKQVSSIIHYITGLFHISLFHSLCIIAIWYSRRYSARIIRATGILLIGESLQLIATAIQHSVETHHIAAGELFFYIISLLLFLTAIIITFLLAKKVSEHEKDLMKTALLTTTISEISIDDGGGFSLV